MPFPGLGPAMGFMAGGGPDLITFVATGTVGGTTPGLPAGWAAGDLHILFATSNAVGSPPIVDTPSGYTSLTSASSTDSTTLIAQLNVFYRVAQGGDSGPTISISNGSLKNTAIAGFRGAAASSMFEATATLNTAQAGGTTSPYANITTLGAGRMVLQAFGWSTGYSTPPTSSVPDGAWFEAVDAGVATVILAVNYKYFPAAGATGTGNITWNNALRNDSGGGRVVTAIKPA